MGQVEKQHECAVKLIAGLLASDSGCLARTRELVRKELGAIDLTSDEVPFTYTTYYNKEMGDGIVRQYVSFSDLIQPGDLWKTKLRTIEIEDSTRLEGRRSMNIDPGYLTECGVVVASTKEAAHRVYLDNGIYGQPMLYYKREEFNAFEFTYPDYADDGARAFFSKVRELYRRQLKSGVTGCDC